MKPLKAEPRRRATTRRFWPTYRSRGDCANTLTYWLRYALAEPRDFSYTAPLRIACHLWGHHSAPCRGIPGHPRR
jgi:hypothetical protein